MAESKNYSDRREHRRSSVAYGVTAVIITTSPEIIGSVIDISMGGVKVTYHEQKDTNLDFPHLKIDLISDDRYVEAIHCKNAWNSKAEDYALYGSGDLRQCGIEFLDLTPNQAFLLKGFINRSADPKVTISSPDISIGLNQ